MTDLAVRTPPPPTATAAVPVVGLGTYLGSFRGMLARDSRVLVHNIGAFLGQTMMQPLLFVFVFTYVFPKIDQGIGSGLGRDFATVLVPGLVATSALFTGISSVAQPLAIEFGATREIEDRAMSPLPVWAIGVEKIVFGAVQSVLAALVVFPLAYFIPATPVSVHVHNWWLLVGVTLIVAVTSGSLGLLLGSIVKPMHIGLMYGILVIPLTFLGCVYYPWQALKPVAWLQDAVLLNPLVYACEGLRNALTPQLPHMALAAYLGASIGILVLLLVGSIRVFVRKIVT